MKFKPKCGVVTLLLVPILVLGLTGCGSQAVESNSGSSGKSAAVQKVGTNGQLISIQSDNVRAAGYDGASMVMTVQFDNGALYEYYGVPADLWTCSWPRNRTPGVRWVTRDSYRGAFHINELGDSLNQLRRLKDA